MRQSILDEMDKKKPHNKNLHDVKEERNAKKAVLINFDHSGTVEVAWDLNEKFHQDQMFVIKIGDRKAVLNKEDVLRFLRWV